MPRHRRLTFLAPLPIALALLLTGCPLVNPPTSQRAHHVTIVGSGTVTTNPQGIDCPGSCTTDFTDGAIADLVATPEAGHTFDTIRLVPTAVHMP